MQSDSNEIIYSTFGLGQALFTGLYKLFGGTETGLHGLYDFLSTAWTVYSVMAFVVSGIFIFGIMYSYIRLSQLSEVEVQQLEDAHKLWKQLHGDQIGNTQWQQVLQHIESTNPNDWKLAIIEADVMLDKLLQAQGYAGTSIGDRLKSVSMRSFQTLDDAWQAHRVRNQIAHGGYDFVLTQKMARTTIQQYQKVFLEFGVV